MEFKQNVLDRIEQTFNFLIDNFLSLILPFGIFYIGVYGIFYGASMYTLSLADTTSFVNPWNYNIAMIVIVLFFTYLILEVAFIIATYKIISDKISGKQINVWQAIIYGFKNIFSSFKTYYYMFMYVYWIPSLIFIIGGFYFIYLEYSGLLQIPRESVYAYIGYGMLAFAIFIFYVVYKSNKIVFALSSAIDSNDYTKENFQMAVNVTNGKWWRVYGNLFLAGFIVGVVSGILGALFGGGTMNYQAIGEAAKNSNINELMELLFKNQFSLSSMISLFLSRCIVAISSVFILVFVFIFYKRLAFESEESAPIEISQSEII